ncbi:GNAT family N-acetyltransferase [Paenibacillus lycopersici]|uniref:GNAT family N-acetyltransferase n=1 Tax=Paenibacillus lycopersici TaxID=2704462 RepID=A0A6C0G704_9BACL|nr:GNAT family N-acetyltransferase [Paenibacillus lycopersici]QHT62445.1 GNAT family N-acetyltransferase [Paenibacillus lycopersici]
MKEQQQEQQEQQEQQQQVQLLMINDNLGELPERKLLEGYGIRSFRSGDETAWERIVAASFGGEHSFEREMAADEAYKPERVWFVTDAAGEPIATASAWYRPQWSENTGYLHMVGLVPEHAGKKLGYAISHAALLQMIREGRTRAVLHTDDFRIPAIKAYLGLGFVPSLTDGSHPGRWKALAGVLDRNFTARGAGGAAVDIRP